MATVQPQAEPIHQPEPKARISERRGEFNGAGLYQRRVISGGGTPICRKPWMTRTFGGSRSIMWHGNLDAIVASHQDAILGSAQMGDAHGEPYADRQQGHREGEGGNVRQHPLPVVIRWFGDALIARQIVGHVQTVSSGGLIPPLGGRRSGAWPKREHAVLLLGRGRYDGSLGSHGCQLRESSATCSTPILFPEAQIRLGQ